MSGYAIMVGKGARTPKHIAIIAVLRSYLSPLFLLLGRDACGDRILRSCLQKGPATTLANYAHNNFVSEGKQKIVCTDALLGPMISSWRTQLWKVNVDFLL